MKVVCKYVLNDAMKNAVKELRKQVMYNNMEVVLGSLLLGISIRLLWRNTNDLSTVLSMIIVTMLIIRLAEVIMKITNLKTSVHIIENFKDLSNNNEHPNEEMVIRNADFLKCNDANLVYTMYILGFDIKTGGIDENVIYVRNKGDVEYSPLKVDNYEVVMDNEEYLEIKTDALVLHKKE